MKKQICVLMALMMIISIPFSAMAAPNQYTPGAMTYSVDFEDVVSLDGATISEGALTINPGGKASFDIFFDSDVAKVNVDYLVTGEGTLNLTLEDNSYDISVSPEVTSANCKVIDRRGAHVITLSSDTSITVTKVEFTKVSVQIGKQNDLIVSLDDYDEATLTSVVVNPAKVAIKVDGAFRYVDYNDTSVTPLAIDGRVYLPIHTAARALSLYYEDYADLNYVYLMDDNIELYASEKGSYTVVNGKKEELGRFAIYVNGTTWVPFRQLAEIFGKTVVSRDGYVIADDRIHANNIIKNETIFKRLVSEFEQFDSSLAVKNNTYYVSQAAYAKDTNDGSENFPFRTIQKAADVAMAGDTVIIHAGTYREKVTVKNDGTAASPIVFRAAGDGEVIISAFDKVSGFESYKGNIYQTIIPKSMGYDRNFVIMNDEIVREGRHPNTDTSDVVQPHPAYDKVNVMRATMGDIAIPIYNPDGSKNNSFDKAYSDKDLNQDQKDYWKGATFITLTGEAWTLSYARVTASTKGEISLEDYPGNTSYGIKYYKEKCDDDYGYLTHHINTIDMPGEWYIDDSSNTLFMMPPEGTNPETLEVEVKQRQVVVDMTDRKFIQFHNISTRGGGLTMAGNTEMNVLNGGSHKYIAQVDWSTAFRTHNCRFYNGTNSMWTHKVDAPEMGEVGFFSHGLNNAFVNTHIAYSSNAGIYTTGTYTYIDNNLIEHTGYMGTYPAGVTMEGVKWDEIDAKYGGHTVVGNTITGAGRANIYMSRNYSVQGSTTSSLLPYLPCEFAFNHIYMGSTVARDTGNIYMYGITPGFDRSKTDLHHNITYDIATDARNSYMAANYYHDGHSSMINTRSNISFATKAGHILSDFYQHTNGDYINYVEKWGNTTPGIVPEGIAGLTISDYPYGKPFNVGSTLENKERFMMNYDRVNEAVTVLAQDAVLEGGATLATDGFIDMEGTDPSVTFKNVNLGEEGSEMSLYYASDKYKFNINNIPQFTIDFIKDGKVVSTRYEQAFMHMTMLNNLSRLTIYLPAELKGSCDVRVKINSDYIRLCKLISVDCDYAEQVKNSPYPMDGDMLLLGSWDACVCSRGCPGPRTKKQTEEIQVIAKTNMSIHDTNTHQLLYKNRHIDKDATKMTMRIGSQREYANTYVKVYADTKSGEPIAQFDLTDYITWNEIGWKTKVITIDLNRTLTAGDHDLYVVYEGHSNGGHKYQTTFGVTDSYYIAFHNGETFKNTPKAE